MKKRLFSLLLALVLLMGMVPVSAYAADPQASSFEMTIWADKEEQPWLFEQLYLFQAAHPQWRISWNVETRSADSTCTQLRNNPASGPDLFFFWSGDRHNLIDAGALAPLTAAQAAEMTAATSPAVSQTTQHTDGRYYGFPLTGNTWFLYYNKAVFSENDVKSLEAMLKKGPVLVDVTNAWYYTAFYFANGCTMFGKNGNTPSEGIRFNGAKGAAVTLRLKELLSNRNFRTTKDTNSDVFLEEIRKGTSSAFFSGYWDYETMHMELGDNLGVAQLPTILIDGQTKQLRSFLNTTAIGVNPHSAHTDAARALASFLAGTESQLMHWQMTGLAPAATALLDNAAIQADPLAKTQLLSLKNTTVNQPAVKEMDTFWANSSYMGQWLLNGEVTTRNAAELTDEWNAMLNGGKNPPPFTDVPMGSFYEAPVLWALENAITTGASDTTFNPNGSCLRAQVVTFLHRAAGSPIAISHVNPFTDVKKTDFFYNPVLWAVHKGITNGVSQTRFGSYDVCNRAAVVTFLWRTAGAPNPRTDMNPFTDVKKTDFFYKPVLWAVEQGITTGLTATTFGPASPCNRAQVVTFLYRAYND